MAPWNNRTCQPSGVFGKAIRDHLEEGEILLKDVLITRNHALALTDRRLMHLSMRNSFMKRSIKVVDIDFKDICDIDIDDMHPHYINGTRPSGFKLTLRDRSGQPSGEWFGENDSIDALVQLLLEMQNQVYLITDRDLVNLPEPATASSLPGELGRKVSFMLTEGECIVAELHGKTGRGLCLTDRRLVLVRSDREPSSSWGERSVIDIPYVKLDRILTSTEIVHPQVVMHMAVYFERFGEPLPGGEAEHLSVLGVYWTEILRLAMIANSIKQGRRVGALAGLTGLS